MRRQILIGLFLLTFFCVATAFAQDEKKIAYGILLDNTATLRTQLDEVKNLGIEIVGQVDKQNIVSIFNFTTVNSTNKKSEQIQIAEMMTGIDWTQDRKSINRYIDNISTVIGQTALVDAVSSGGEKVSSKVNLEKDKFSEKILIVITDGEDRISKTNPKGLLKFLKENNIKVYAIGLLEGFGSDSEWLGASPRVNSKKFLESITKETGGRVVFPKAKQTTAEVVKELLAKDTKESK